MSIGDKKLMSITNMTLREYYAGLAMQGLLANKGYYWQAYDDCNYGVTPAFCANLSIQYADALMAELDKSK